VLGNAASATEESFAAGLLDFPSYTRPASFRGLDVPPILLSGDHGAVERWRAERRQAVTRRKRPDLIEPTRSQTAPSKRPRGTS
jgi:tRNA (guanine37-N1)-methyltransferase